MKHLSKAAALAIGALLASAPIAAASGPQGQLAAPAAVSQAPGPNSDLTPENGYETHNIVQEWGDYNLFTNNSGTVNAPGYGFAIWPARHNTVACSNSLSGAARGLSNVQCTNP